MDLYNPRRENRPRLNGLVHTRGFYFKAIKKEIENLEVGDSVFIIRKRKGRDDQNTIYNIGKAINKKYRTMSMDDKILVRRVL